ncbi:MAG: class I SAM-dependent methyltransferase [Anaerolineales bacterium]|nr:class I SAM-dependent methyltransferase [Anaerolineales bacterium]
MTEKDIKLQVREFYNQVGWHQVSDGIYQNARYEDLRPVAREYIHRCHMRVCQHLAAEGRYLLDAGSGPIQYPEYLEYSKGYEYRVCADISILALKEARKRIGDHGLYVVADIANLPFASGVFEGVVSLHTVHHLPLGEHIRAYNELFRLVKTGRTAVVVNGWHKPPLGETLRKLRKFTLRVQGFISHRLLRRKPQREMINPIGSKQKGDAVKSTFVEKNSPAWFKNKIGSQLPLEIRVWRSVSVKDMRTFVHEGWGGRGILRSLYWLEDRFPGWFGRNGQYPLVVIYKP